jgi:hypothetical protein
MATMYENLATVWEVLSRPSKSERFFIVSLIFTLNHRCPKMSKFATSVKKIIETIFLNTTSHSDSDSWGYCKARRKLVVGSCGERITLQ